MEEAEFHSPFGRLRTGFEMEHLASLRRNADHDMSPKVYMRCKGTT